MALPTPGRRPDRWPRRHALTDPDVQPSTQAVSPTIAQIKVILAKSCS
jgi:hypothetical protein